MKTHVVQSAIEGKGLVALERIKAKEYIGTYRGIRAKKNGRYVLWVGDEPWYIRNKYRYVNHSSTPNAVLEEFELTSLRVIKPGEEITIHYGDDWDE